MQLSGIKHNRRSHDYASQEFGQGTAQGGGQEMEGGLCRDVWDLDREDSNSWSDLKS